MYSRPLPSEKIVEGAEGRGRLYSGYRKQGAGKESESSLARFLALELKRLLPIHNISWWSCAFAIG